MTRQDYKRARIFILALIMAAVFFIGGVTALFFWKGLENLPSNDEYSPYYYVLY